MRSHRVPGGTEVLIPNGWEEIRQFYGWNNSFIGLDGKLSPAWEGMNFSTFHLKPSVELKFEVQPGVLRPVTRLYLHKKVGWIFVAAIEDVFRHGLGHTIENYGGGFAFRQKRGIAKLSMHALGCAVDFDPTLNPLGVEPQDTALGGTAEGRAAVRILQGYGLTWGGEWSRPDAMHFQFGDGY